MKTFIVKRETGDIELTMNEAMHLFFDLERKATAIPLALDGGLR